MKIIKQTWLIPALLTLVILTAGGVFLWNVLPKEVLLTDSEIQSQLESMYGGTVNRLSIENDIYNAEMVRNGAVYSATIDAVTGSVLSLIKTGKSEEIVEKVLTEAEITKIITEKYTGEADRISLNQGGEESVYEVDIVQNQELITVKINAFSGEIISQKAKETTVKHPLITMEKAIKIALAQLKGEVEYVSLEHTDDGGFYLIEIEGEEEEAEFQIHAVSGEILSITWDD